MQIRATLYFRISESLNIHLHRRGCLISRGNTEYDTMTSLNRVSNTIKLFLIVVTVITVLLLEEVTAVRTLLIMCLSLHIECLYDIHDFKTNTGMYINIGQSYFTACV